MRSRRPKAGRTADVQGLTAAHLRTWYALHCRPEHCHVLVAGDVDVDATARQLAETFGDLFPEGSETGFDTEAKSTIWTDRAGFDKALAEFKQQADAAVAANPQTLAELQPAAGAVFKTCKSCHEGYRVDD